MRGCTLCYTQKQIYRGDLSIHRFGYPLVFSSRAQGRLYSLTPRLQVRVLHYSGSSTERAGSNWWLPPTKSTTCTHSTAGAGFCYFEILIEGSCFPKKLGIFFDCPFLEYCWEHKHSFISIEEYLPYPKL